MRKKWFAALAILAIILVVVAASFLFRGFIFNKVAGSIIFKAGKPIKFGSYTVFIDRISGNKLFGIKITQDNRKFEAKSGDYTYLPKENSIKFNLTDGIAEDVDPKNPNAIRRLTFKQAYVKVRLKPLLPK